MKTLIKGNLIVGAVAAITTVATQSSIIESLRIVGLLLFLAQMVSYAGLFGLVFVNLVGIFRYWKDYRLRALLPIASYAAAVAFGCALAAVGTHLVVAGTPSDPDSFMSTDNRAELEYVAQRLLGNSFKEIYTFPGDSTEVNMIAGENSSELPQEIERKLRDFGFEITFIDDAQALVEFSHVHLRSWYDYTYSPVGLQPAYYTKPVSITEVDIEDWGELIKIAKQGPTASRCEMNRIVFFPPLVYPRLQDALGEDFLGRIRKYKSPSQLTKCEKEQVLAALNQLRMVSSRLVEDTSLVFEVMELESSRTHPTTAFKVTTLISQCLKDGTLIRAEDGVHLRIASNLTPAESTKVEWIHVCLLGSRTGNLIEKRVHTFSRDLGGGWYFGRS